MRVRPPFVLRIGTEADTDVLARRAVAFAVDVGAWLVVTSLPGFELLSTGATSVSYGALGFLAYLAVTQAAFAQTLGKYLLGVGVADATGGPPSTGQAVGRSLLLAVDAVALGVPALVSVAFSDRRQRVGDRAVGTVVVRAER